MSYCKPNKIIGCWLVTKFVFEIFSLQDMVNKYKMKKKSMEEGVLFYYTIALLRILETMHACDVIHGDIKPDNFLVLDR